LATGARATANAPSIPIDNRNIATTSLYLPIESIIRARAGVSTDDGFDRLRQISQSQNTKLRVVAQQLVEQAVRRAQARHRPT
jgi:hypothetical protein